jgi:hypothetical protein
MSQAKMHSQPSFASRTWCAISRHFHVPEIGSSFSQRTNVLSFICLLFCVTFWKFLKSPIPEKTTLPITGISVVTSSSLNCFIRLHSELRTYAAHMPLIIAVEHDFVGDFGENTMFQRLPPNTSNAAAINLLIDLSTTPLIFFIDAEVVFDVDFIPALRMYSDIILEGEYDVIGGCISSVDKNCSGYLYDFLETESSIAHTSSRTLRIKPFDLSASDNIIKADAVDSLFLASKAALQSIKFDSQISSGELIDFFLRSLMILRVGASSDLSAVSKSPCKRNEHSTSSSYSLGALFHKWGLKKILDPLGHSTTLVCSDGQLDAFPESLQLCQIHSPQHSPSSSQLISDPYPPFYSRISKTTSFSKVGIVVAATGKYSKFLSPFIASFRSHFLPKSSKMFFVFANSRFPEDQDTDVVVFPQHSLGWPYNSLYRFRLALTMIDKMDVEYLFMADVDLQVVNEIDERIISDLVATIAPFSWGLPSVAFPFDRHPASPAYMHPSEGARFYFAGGFFGGSKDSVRAMVEYCARMADEMLAMIPAYVSPWHDESILNMYFHKVRKPTLIAGPEFLYPDPPYDISMLTIQQKIYSQHIPPLIYNLGVRKADKDKEIREPDPAVLPNHNLSVIKRAHPVKPFSCSAVVNSMSSLLCGMFVLSGGSFHNALDHCSNIGMQLCNSMQLDLLARAGYCNCFRTWAADGNILRPHPQVSECNQCSKCGVLKKISAEYCSSIAYDATTTTADAYGIACCRLISSDELISSFSGKNTFSRNA